MPIAFGFSVGDFIGGVEFICALIEALQESAGSSSRYTRVVDALESSKDVLTQLEGLHLHQQWKSEVDKILKRYEDTTLIFAKKLAKYDRFLGNQASRSSFKTILRQIQWQRYGEKEVVWLQDQLQQHSSALQVVLFRAKQYVSCGSSE
ncbi:hypothetical protein LTR36_008801 [Oleoguttula mirabilis]|uniref:Uncharacterized protein n=1 Tax=Oleoguttula mirabilis TaxID=1507867 RepID=A0AAV9J827_9PEZI|nr:hypothetical protein LTR36_008801 [Oleoguttula mirabilis]